MAPASRAWFRSINFWPAVAVEPDAVAAGAVAGASVAAGAGVSSFLELLLHAEISMAEEISRIEAYSGTVFIDFPFVIDGSFSV